MRHSTSAKNYFQKGRVLLVLLLLLLFLLALGAFLRFPLTIDGVGVLLLKGEMGQVISPYDGAIENWLVEEGASVLAGERVATIRQSEGGKLAGIHAYKDGVVAEIVSFSNTMVRKGEPIAFITSIGDVKKDLQVISFVSSLYGKKIKPGMIANVDPSITSKYRDGVLKAEVDRVGKLPTTKSALQSLVKIPELASYIRNQIEAEPFMVTLSLKRDVTHVSGYSWSGRGPTFELDSGVFATIEVEYERPRVLELVWPSLSRKIFGDG